MKLVICVVGAQRHKNEVNFVLWRHLGVTVSNDFCYSAESNNELISVSSALPVEVPHFLKDTGDDSEKVPISGFS